jgi:hypothetical protein
MNKNLNSFTTLMNSPNFLKQIYNYLDEYKTIKLDVLEAHSKLYNIAFISGAEKLYGDNFSENIITTLNVLDIIFDSSVKIIEENNRFYFLLDNTK